MLLGFGSLMRDLIIRRFLLGLEFNNQGGVSSKGSVVAFAHKIPAHHLICITTASPVQCDATVRSVRDRGVALG